MNYIEYFHIIMIFLLFTGFVYPTEISYENYSVDPIKYLKENLPKKSRLNVTLVDFNGSDFYMINGKLESNISGFRFIETWKTINREGAIKKLRDNGIKNMKVPLFELANIVPGKVPALLNYSVEYLFPEAGVDKIVEAVTENLQKSYITKMSSLFPPIGIIRALNCWNIETTMPNAKNKITKKIFKEVASSLCDDSLIDIIEVAKPNGGLSFLKINYNLQKKSRSFSGLIARNFNFKSFLPLIDPLAYAVDVTDSFTEGCNGLKDVINIKSFSKGIKLPENIKGAFQLSIATGNIVEKSLDCIGKKLTKQNWKELDIKGTIGSLRNSVENFSKNVSSATGKVQNPVISIDTSGIDKTRVSTVNKVNDVFDNISSLPELNMNNYKLFFSLEKPGIIIVGGGINKIISKDNKYTETKIMVMEINN